MIQDCGHLVDDDRDLFNVFPTAKDLTAQATTQANADTLLIWCAALPKTSILVQPPPVCMHACRFTT